MSNNYDEVWKKEKVIKLTNSITDLMGKKTLSSMIARIDKMSQHEIETYPLLMHTENDDVEHVQDMLFNIFLTEDNNNDNDNDNKFDKIQSFTESQLPFQMVLSRLPNMKDSYDSLTFGYKLSADVMYDMVNNETIFGYSKDSSFISDIMNERDIEEEEEEEKGENLKSNSFVEKLNEILIKYKNDENTELVGSIKETINLFEDGMVVSKVHGEDNWCIKTLENKSIDDESNNNSNFSSFVR